MWRAHDEDEEQTSDAASSTSHLRTSQYSNHAASVISTASSSRSLAATFSSLDEDDVHFFDELISAIALGDGSFATLKASYEELRDIRLRGKPERDAHLWDLLLSLVKVRGRDWSERWDAVRIGLGMDMRGADSTIETVQSDSQGDQESQTSRTESTQRGHTEDDAETQWTQETSQSEGSNADASSSDDTEAFSPGRRRIRLASKDADRHVRAGGTTRTDSSSSNRTIDGSKWAETDNIAALKARMDALTRRAGALAIQARHQDPREPYLKERRYSRSEDETSATSPSEDVIDRRRVNAQQRIDEVIAATRSNRESLREAALRRAEESEDAAWSGTERLAQRHHDQYLLSTCWSWWHQVSSTLAAKHEQARIWHESALMASTLHFWHHMSVDDPALSVTATRANQVRVQLSCWRTWRRLAKAKQDRQWEERKKELKEKYNEVKRRRFHRLAQSSWTTWCTALREQRGARFRRGHLLGGAFFLWRIKLEVSKSLGTQEHQLVERKTKDVQENLFLYWRQAAQLSRLSNDWQASHERDRLRNAFEELRTISNLNAVCRVYSNQRLQRLALRTWLERLADHAQLKRRQSQADRLRVRSSQRRSLSLWRKAFNRAQARHTSAVSFKAEKDLKTVAVAWTTWQREVKGNLAARVSEGLRAKAAFDRWRTVLHTVTVLSASKAERMVVRQSRSMVTECFSHWKALNARQTIRVSEAIRVADKRLLTEVMRRWTTTHEHHANNRDKAAAVHDLAVLRSTWHSMRMKVRETRLIHHNEERSKRLVVKTFSSWRARALQNVRDRLNTAQVQAQRIRRIQRTALRQWMQHVIERRSLLLEVSEAYKDKMLISAIERWRSALAEVRDLDRLAQSFRDVKDEEIQQAHLQEWHSRYRKTHLLRVRSEEFDIAKAQRVMQHAFSQWYDSWRSEELRELEYEVAVQRQESAKARVLSQWVRRTPLVPAIRLRNTRLKHLALQRWRSSLPAAILVRRAIEFDEDATKRKAVSFWRESARSSKATRQAARFGGLSVKRLKRLSSSRRQSPFVPYRPRRSNGSAAGRSSSSPIPEEDLFHREMVRPPSAPPPRLAPSDRSSIIADEDTHSHSHSHSHSPTYSPTRRRRQMGTTQSEHDYPLTSSLERLTLTTLADRRGETSTRTTSRPSITQSLARQRRVDR